MNRSTKTAPKRPFEVRADNRPSWPFLSLRDYLFHLDERGRLLHVDKPSDARFEIGAVSKRLMELGSDKACMFWNVHSSHEDWHVEPPYDVLVDGTHRHVHMVEDAFNVSRDEIFENWIERIRPDHLVDPVEVDRSEAPCKEVVIPEEEVDLFKIPVDMCTGKMGGPFISKGVCFTRHPDTGISNFAIYRLHVKGPKHTGILIVPNQHVASVYAKFGSEGKNMPMACAIGVDPLMAIISGAPVPVSTPENRVWGALAGTALPVVKAELSDLTVPAYAEYILEGEVLHDVRDTEGPYGEYTGYYSGIRDLPVFKVKCITHRKRPIYEAVTIGKPPSEGNFLVEMGFNLEMTRGIREYLPEVKAVRSLICHGLVTVVQLDKKRRYKGLAFRAGHMVWSKKALVKNVLVIDDDIDIWDNDDVWWAFATHTQGHKSVHIVPDVSGCRLDPSEPFGGEEGISCKMIIDCTEPFPPYHAPYMRGVAGPDEKTYKEVLQNWTQYFQDGAP
ncbi:MAG: UbiD family decarboxylase [Nitrospinota bacterium]